MKNAFFPILWDQVASGYGYFLATQIHHSKVTLHEGTTL